MRSRPAEVAAPRVVAHRHGVDLAWPRCEGEQRYRVVLNDALWDEVVLRDVVERTRYSVPAGALHPGRRYEWKVQMAASGGGWRDATPYLALPRQLSLDAVTTSVRWEPDGSLCYRMVVRDEVAGEIVIKDGVTEASYVVDWSELERSHRHRYKIQAWRGEVWVDLLPYAELTPPREYVVVSEAPAATAPEVQPLLFLFTVDTETSLRHMADPDVRTAVDDQVFGIRDGRDYGIRFQMDLLEQHGFKGTFFLDILAEYEFGEGCFERAIEEILARGHDVQLHVHPNPNLQFAPDDAVAALSTAMTHGDVDAFRRVMAIAVDRFERSVGRRPIAFRAGSYHVCDGFFPVLEEFEIPIDSSIYPFKNCRVSPWLATRTQPFRVGNVLELPVSWMVVDRAEGPIATQFAPGKGGVGQAAAALAARTEPGAPPGVITFLAHSFTLLEDVRCASASEREAWNEAVVRRGLLPRVGQRGFTMDDGTNYVYFGGPNERRIAHLSQTFADLAASGAIGLSLDQFYARHMDLWPTASGPIEPLPIWDTRSRTARTTGIRQNTRDLLAHYEGVT
jgi:hypothetical protein